MNWAMLAFLGSLSLATMFLLVKWLSALHVKSHIVLLYLFFVAGFLYLGYAFTTKSSLAVSAPVFFIIAAAALFSFIGNLLLFNSVALAPNPGYSLAINSAYIVYVGVISIFLFKSEISIMKIVGVLLAIAGIILVSL